MMKYGDTRFLGISLLLIIQKYVYTPLGSKDIEYDIHVFLNCLNVLLYTNGFIPRGLQNLLTIHFDKFSNFFHFNRNNKDPLNFVNNWNFEMY